MSPAWLLALALGAGLPGGPELPRAPRRDWRAEVLTPTSREVLPRRVVAIEPRGGEVLGADGVLGPGGGGLTLRKGDPDSDPRVVLDFGIAVGGWLEAGFSAPSARVLFAFSETRQGLGDWGDTFGSTSDIAAADRDLPQRERRFESPHEAEVEAAGVWRDPELRGGFRYLMIRLAPEAPAGSEARLDFVRLDYGALPGLELGDLDQLYAGHFSSSSAVLDRAWYAGAATLALATIDPRQGIENGTETVGAGRRVLADGAKRDRLIWNADLAGAARVSYASFHDLDAVLASLESQAAGQGADGYLPACSANGAARAAAPRYLEYHFWWLLAALDWERESGDDEAFERLWPALVAGLELIPTRLAREDLWTNPVWQGATELLPGHTLGQSFRARAPFRSVAAFLHTYRSAGAGVTLRLRRGGASGPVAFERALSGIPDNAWSELELPAEEPAGDYVLEAAEPVARVGWGGADGDAWPDGEALADGVAVDGDRTLGYRARGGSGGPLVDTSAEPGHTSYAAGGRDAVASVLAVVALEGAAALAARRGDLDLAARWHGLAQEIRAEIDAALWDASVGALRRSPLDDRSWPHDANVLAAAFAVLDPARASGALDFVRDQLSTPWGSRVGLGALPGHVSPFLVAWEVEALFAARRDAEAFERLDRTWGHMVARPLRLAGAEEDPAATTWEHVAEDGSPFRGKDGSLAHPWSAGATWLLSSRVLGLTRVTGGGREWRAEPHPGKLGWAEGRLATRHGALSAKWRRLPRGFRLDLEVPEGTRGTVAIPLFEPMLHIADRGRAVWDGVGWVPGPGSRGAHLRDGYVEIEGVTPGRHEFLARAIAAPGGEPGYAPTSAGAATGLAGADLVTTELERRSARSTKREMTLRSAPVKSLNSRP